MNLIVDQGNTFLKMAVFDGGELLWQEQWQEPDSAAFRGLIDRFSINAVICSSVKGETNGAVCLLRSRFPEMLFLTHQTPLPITLGYRTPQTLGRDRIASAVGAYARSNGCSSLVIDAGTALTIDFIDRNGVFEGGNITPGIRSRLRALNDYTHALPLVEVEGETPYLGVDTQTAIRSGVIQGINHEIEGYISTFQAKDEKLLTWITGGDAKYFDINKKSSIFVLPNLVLEGLNRILQYNDSVKK